MPHVSRITRSELEILHCMPVCDYDRQIPSLQFDSARVSIADISLKSYTGFLLDHLVDLGRDLEVFVFTSDLCYREYGSYL